METLIADLKQALRMCRKSPGFTATAVAALALGIGANTAIFSVVNTVLLKPLPYPDPDRVVQILLSSPQGQAATASVPEYNNWHSQTAILEDVAAYDAGGPGVNLTSGDRPEQLKGIRVSREYFSLFGAAITRGRAFTAEDDRPGGGHLAILSDGLWQRRFGGNPAIVGQTILLGGDPYTVIGIVSPAFRPDPPVDIYLPFQADPNSVNGAHYFRGAARLRPGVTLQQANAGMALAAEEFNRKFPNVLPAKGTFALKPMQQVVIGNIKPALLVLLGAVGCVLLIACANIANLLLSRATGRAREMAIRAAIGAGRGRIVRQLLTESLLLSVIGGAAGLLLGVIGVRALLAINPGNIPRIGKDGAAVALDWTVLGFTLLLSVLTGLLFGLAPALHASRVDLNSTLKESGSRSGAGRQNTTRGVLVVVEMALAIVLLVGAGLLIRTFVALHSVPPGFDAHNILTLETSLTGGRFSHTADIAGMVRRTEERMEAIPGVQFASVATSLPLEPSFGLPFVIEGRPLSNGPFHGGSDWRYVSYRYFDVFKIPIVRGRGFTIRDEAGAPFVALINESFARTFFAKENPVGQRLSIGKGTPVFGEPAREIVGVVADVHEDGLNQDAGPIMYVPLSQVKDGVMGMNNNIVPLVWAVRTAAEPYSLSLPIQRAVQDAAGLPVGNVRSMDLVVIQSTARNRFNTTLLAIFACSAILLASLGLYGLMAYSVQQRTLEFGIRLALGAEGASLRNMIVGQAMKLALAGVGIGLAAAYGLTRLMASLLFGVQPRDPLVFGAVAVLLTLVALVAALLPARHAVKIDPIVALRYE
jgi:putative ABC transport system permease protein